MNLVQEEDLQKVAEDDYFEIIRNFRRVEKTKRRKLLKKYKLMVAAERKM